MNKDRLGFSALINIHRDMENDYQEVAKTFFQFDARNLNRNNLIYV